MLQNNIKRKIFVSYHHDNDQWYADQLKSMASDYEIFTDRSLDRRINSANTDYVQWKIKEEYLKGTSVTVVLCGAETYKRKYVDWEIYHTLELRHGLIGIFLPQCPVSHNGGYIPPARLSDNNGYVIYEKWSDFLMLSFNQSLEHAFERSQSKTLFINNNREKMTRNAS